MRIIILTFLVFSIGMIFPSASLGPARGQEKQRGFALYLLPGSIKPHQLKDLDISKLKPAGEPLITAADLHYYQKDRHELALTYDAGKRLKNQVLELRGRSFVVFVDNEPIYTGAFWLSIWSSSFDGIYIDLAGPTSDFPVFKLGLGYPKNFKNLPDARPDPRIFETFARAGLLQQELFIRGKCKKISNTYARRPGVIFTFSVGKVVKGDFSGAEITFNTYADNQGARLLGALDAIGELYGKDDWQFDPDKEILLKFEQRLPASTQIPYFSSFDVN